MNKLFYFTLLFPLFLIAEQQEIAIITKNKGSIQYKNNKSEKFIKKLNPGFELFNKDLLITGNDGFAMFAYLDDGSLVKLHKDSQLYVGGNLKNNIINKEINVDDGFILFDIKKQKNNEFKVVTPSSVASVKGTVFILDVTEFGDVFYGFEGNVEILNKESNQKFALQKSKKISSSIDGVINIDNISREDVLYLNEIQEETGSEMYEIDETEIDTGDINQESNERELVIILTNSFGEEKKLIIKFNEQ